MLAVSDRRIGCARGICTLYMRTKRYAGDQMVDRQSKIVDLIVLAAFAGVIAFILSDDRGLLFTVFVAISLIFLAAAVSIMYSYEKKQEI